MADSTEEMVLEARASGKERSVLEMVTVTLHGQLRERTGLQPGHVEFEEPEFTVTLIPRKGKDNYSGTASSFDAALEEASSHGAYDATKVQVDVKQEANVPYHTLDFVARALDPKSVARSVAAKVNALAEAYGNRLVRQPEDTMYRVVHTSEAYRRDSIPDPIPEEAIAKAHESHDSMRQAVERDRGRPKKASGTVYEARWIMKIYGPQGETLPEVTSAEIKGAPAVITSRKAAVVTGACMPAGEMPYAMPKEFTFG